MSIGYNTSDNTAQNHFINPPEPGLINEYTDNNVYVLGSTIDLSWQTNYTSIQFLLWQNNNSSSQLLPTNVLRQVSDGSAAWDVNLDGLFSLKQGNVFFFWIVSSKSLESGNPVPAHFSSHYFNISDPSSTTSGASSTTSDATSKTMAATSKTSPPATQTASQDRTHSNGGTNATTLGVGIGVGVGVFLLLLLGGTFWIYRKRRSRLRLQVTDGTAINAQPSSGSHAELTDPKNQPSGAGGGISELTTEGNEYNELPGYSRAPQEMSTSNK